MSNVLGIIAEYNPFHNGHFYHIQESKIKTNADYCVCVISGNFTQRGEPSIVNKWTKAYMAVCGGADLVIELPTLYATSSAENFANGAIKVLDNLKIVNNISFGAECNDLGILNNIANVIYNKPKEYLMMLNHELKKGASFPTAREKAIMLYLNDIKKYANILSNSNNILAIEYLRAMKENKSLMNPVLVQRRKVYYNDNRIIDDFASATAIRKLVSMKEYAQLRKVVPGSTYKILIDELKRGKVILGLEIFEKEILYNLRKMSIEEIAQIPDVTEGLEYSIKKAAGSCNNLKDFIENVKSKRYTQTRIQRILVYTLLGIDKKTMNISRKIEPYTRILAFNSKGKKLISEINRVNPKIQMITSVKKFVEEKNNKSSSKNLLKMLEKDLFATDVYTLGFEYESYSNLDYTNNMIIIK